MKEVHIFLLFIPPEFQPGSEYIRFRQFLQSAEILIRKTDAIALISMNDDDKFSIAVPING